MPSWGWRALAKQRLVRGGRPRPESPAAARSGTVGCCRTSCVTSPTANCRCFPSPSSAWPTRSTRSRLMAPGSHTGKIVISIPADGSIEAVAPRRPSRWCGVTAGTSWSAAWAVSVSSSRSGWRPTAREWLSSTDVRLPTPMSRRRSREMNANGSRSRGGHRRHRRARYRRAPGRRGRGRGTAARRGAAQRDGAGRRDRAEHVGVRGGAGVRPEGRGQLVAAPGHRGAGLGLVADLLLGRFTCRLTRTGRICGRELLGRRPGRLPAIPGAARGRNQLGPMGGGRARRSPSPIWASR